MVAEIIAGITLVNGAYKAIKECINNVNDVSQIAGHLDQLIDGKKIVNCKMSSKKLKLNTTFSSNPRNQYALY